MVSNKKASFAYYLLNNNAIQLLSKPGARYSSVVRAFAYSTPACVGTSPWCRGEHSLWEWPIPTQLLVWGTLFAVRCNPWSGRWDPGGWVMVNVCNRVHCHWQYTTSARSSCRREVRNGPTWSIGWSRQAREQTTFVLFIFCHEQTLLYTICICCSWSGG